MLSLNFESRKSAFDFFEGSTSTENISASPLCARHDATSFAAASPTASWPHRLAGTLNSTVVFAVCTRLVLFSSFSPFDHHSLKVLSICELQNNRQTCTREVGKVRILLAVRVVLLSELIANKLAIFSMLQLFIL